MGRKAWIPTKEDKGMIELMCVAGVSREQIAEVMKVDVKTLSKHCNDILITARPRANSKIAGALYQNAIKGNVTAQIFWLKTRAGWRETDHTQEAATASTTVIINALPKPEK